MSGGSIVYIGRATLESSRGMSSEGIGAPPIRPGPLGRCGKRQPPKAARQITSEPSATVRYMSEAPCEMRGLAPPPKSGKPSRSAHATPGEPGVRCKWVSVIRCATIRRRMPNLSITSPLLRRFGRSGHFHPRRFMDRTDCAMRWHFYGKADRGDYNRSNGVIFLAFRPERDPGTRKWWRRITGRRYGPAPI